MANRSTRTIPVLFVAIVLGSACGARVTPSQVAAVRGGTSNGGAVSAAGDASAGTSSQVTVAGAPAPSAGTGAAATAAAGSAGSATPASGNGGATDVGVSATTVTLGNVSTLSGPKPGLFEGAVVGAQAVLAYQNSLGGMFGRTFKLDVRDDQFDTGQNRSETVDGAAKDFGMLGSFSIFDDAAVPALQASGIPDLTYSLSGTRRAMPNNFSVAPSKEGLAPTTEFLWFKEHFPDAVTKVGSIYGDIPSAKANQFASQAAAESVGWHFVYTRGAQATETDFTADVIRMRQAGVRFVFEIAEDDATVSRLLTAMQQQGFKPDVIRANYYLTIPKLAGAAAEGMYAGSPQALFGGVDDSVVPEVKLMDAWIQKVKPGFVPDLFAAYAWAEGRLMFQAMQRVGPKLTRAALNSALRGITDFSANDLVGPAGPGDKRPTVCSVIAQVKGGRFQRVAPANGFLCNGVPHQS